MGNYSGYVKLHWKKYHMSLIYRYVVSFLSQFITAHIYDLNILHYIIDDFIHLYIINTINIGNTVLDTQKKITLHTYTHYYQTLKKNVIIIKKENNNNNNFI